MLSSEYHSPEVGDCTVSQLASQPAGKSCTPANAQMCVAELQL